MSMGRSSDPGREAPPNDIFWAHAAGVAGVHPSRHSTSGPKKYLEYADDVVDVPVGRAGARTERCGESDAPP